MVHKLMVIDVYERALNKLTIHLRFFWGLWKPPRRLPLKGPRKLFLACGPQTLKASSEQSYNGRETKPGYISVTMPTLEFPVAQRQMQKCYRDLKIWANYPGNILGQRKTYSGKRGDSQALICFIFTSLKVLPSFSQTIDC